MKIIKVAKTNTKAIQISFWGRKKQREYGRNKDKKHIWRKKLEE